MLEDTLAGVLDRYPQLATVACVPLGVSTFSHEDAMRPHTVDEAAAVCDLVGRWQSTDVYKRQGKCRPTGRDDAGQRRVRFPSVTRAQVMRITRA